MLPLLYFHIYIYICICECLCLCVCVVVVLSFLVSSCDEVAITRLAVGVGLLFVRTSSYILKTFTYQAFRTSSFYFCCCCALDVLCSLHIGLCDVTVLIGFIFCILFIILPLFFSQTDNRTRWDSFKNYCGYDCIELIK